MADYAAVFDSNTDVALRTATAINNRAAYTLTGWLYPTSLAATGFIFSLNRNDLYDSNENYGLGTDGKLFVAPNLFSATAGATVLTINTWYWLALVRTAMAGDQRIYLDSVQQVTLTNSTEFASTANRMEFGNALDTNAAPLRCRLAYWRAWDVALNTTEIAAEKTSTTPVKTASLWANWPMQSDLNDTTANARHLTGTGITYGDGPGIAAAAAKAKAFKRRSVYFFRKGF